MQLGRRGRAVMLVTTGLVAGYLVGPPIVHAAGSAASAVIIQSYTGSKQAKVSSSNRLFVDTEAGVTAIGSSNYFNTFGLAFTQPNGEVVLATGTTTGIQILADCGIISGIVLDSGAAATLTINEVGGFHRAIWKGTVGAAGGHIGDTFDGGIFELDGAVETLTGTGQFIVYGEDLAGQCGADAAKFGAAGAGG